LTRGGEGATPLKAQRGGKTEAAAQGGLAKRLGKQAGEPFVESVRHCAAQRLHSRVVRGGKPWIFAAPIRRNRAPRGDPDPGSACKNGENPLARQKQRGTVEAQTR